MNPAWLSQLANHLWQSTLFAGIAGLLTLALRRNHARVRHGVWLAASAKFLVPCSILIALGGQLQWRVAQETTQSGFTVVMDEVGQPFTASPVSSHLLSKSTPAVSPLPEILAGIWICGFFGIVCSWWIRWRRIRASVRAGSPVNVELPIAALSSPSLLEPGVFGVFRPVLLLPDGIVDRLTPAQLRAVIAHELCHVRNRDNLTAAIQMFVETVFWFHPLVWWIGKRLVEERERACDEEVLGVYTDPRTYADAILSVCRLYTESPLRCASGVAGANLRKRIEAIMINRKLRELNLVKKAVLCAVGLMAFAIPIVVGVVNAPAIRAQPRSPSRQQFEVASIKPSKNCGFALGAPPPPSGSAKKTGPTSAPGGLPGPSPGRMNACGTLEQLIRTAYLAPNPGTYGNAVPIEGGPAWIRSESNLYQIAAKPNGPASQAMMRGPMMQALLEDRFKLKIRRETREGPAYALTVAPGGPKLPRFHEGSCTPYTFPPPTLPSGQEFCEESMGRNGTDQTVYRQAIDLDTFATFLFVLTDRPVINRTGLAGRFDIRLEYTPDETTPAIARRFAEARRGDPAGAVPAASDPAGGLSIFTALQQQLGLKLEATKGPRDYLVIEHIERPSAN
jgi:bla regulator protein BlaR1